MFAQDSPLVILDTSVFLSALLSKNPIKCGKEGDPPRPHSKVEPWRNNSDNLQVLAIFHKILSPNSLIDLIRIKE